MIAGGVILRSSTEDDGEVLQLPCRGYPNVPHAKPELFMDTCNGFIAFSALTYDKTPLSTFWAKLSGGVTVIQVGAQTDTELKEKKLRAEDALNATKAAVEEGIVVGGGCTLLRLSSMVDAIKETLDNDEQKTRPHATVEVEISEDMQLVHFDFNSSLSVDYYAMTCPKVEKAVSAAVKQATTADKTVPAALLRMHFHDCFVRGCDGPVLLNSTKSVKDEALCKIEKTT